MSKNKRRAILAATWLLCFAAGAMVAYGWFYGPIPGEALSDHRFLFWDGLILATIAPVGALMFTYEAIDAHAEHERYVFLNAVSGAVVSVLISAVFIHLGMAKIFPGQGLEWTAPLVLTAIPASAIATKLSKTTHQS